MATSGQFRLYEVHSPDKMYVIRASYFTAGKYGVMFFDDKDEGIGFVPHSSLDLLRIAIPPKVDVDELIKLHNVSHDVSIKRQEK